MQANECREMTTLLKEACCAFDINIIKLTPPPGQTIGMIVRVVGRGSILMNLRVIDPYKMKHRRGIEPCSSQQWNVDLTLCSSLCQPDGDKHLDMHIDECDVTFNFAITSHENFE
eukprot:127928-Amphidinium_carterae.1